MLPNFLIVGAEKAGTTTLADLLMQHPEIFICDPKEPRFFSNHNWSRGLEWYKALFENAVGCKAVGEASPAYTWGSDEVPKRIYETLGNIKYIYCPSSGGTSHFPALIIVWTVCIFGDSPTHCDISEIFVECAN